MRLKGEVALITGSTKGIGRGIAEMYAAEGASVIITGRTEAAGAEVEQGIRDAGGHALFVKTDVSDEDQIAAAVAAGTERFGNITILVNNAAPLEDIFSANPIDGPITDIETAKLSRVLDVMLWSVIWSCKHTVPRMIAAGHGAIINISSAAALQGSNAIVGYTASKGAINSLTRQIAKDYGPSGVRCNTIVVGAVVSGQTTGDHMLDLAYAESMNNAHMIGMGRNEDVAYAATYLASPVEARWVTGTQIAVDGGLTVNTAFIAPAFVDHSAAAAANG